MSDPTQPANPVRLTLDFGEIVEIGTDEVYSPAEELSVPAVVLRLPPYRAIFLGRVLDAYTRVSRLIGLEVDALEFGLGWALRMAGGAVDPAPDPISGPPRGPVPELRRLRLAKVLREYGLTTDEYAVVAVAEAAAWWLGEPDGAHYAHALLGALLDDAGQQAAFKALVGEDA